MTQMAIEPAESVFATLRLKPVCFVSEMRIAAVIQWYAEQRISQERAAEIAGLSRFELIDELRRSKVPAIQISASELKAEPGEVNQCVIANRIRQDYSVAAPRCAGD